MALRLTTCVALILFLPGLLRAQTPDAALPDPSNGHFPTFGVSAENLDGWTPIPPVSPENIARWALLDPKTQQPQAIMELDVGRSGEGLVAYAQNQAQNLGGVVAGDVKIDGERGILVTANGVASIIAKHGDLLYIVGLRQAQGGHEKDFLALAASLHWMDIEPPVQHLDLTGPVAALGGSISVRLPACMRPRAGENTTAVLNMVATDIVNRREFGALFQTATLSAPGSLAQAQKDLLDGWNKKLQPLEAFAWTTDPKYPGTALTNQVQIDVVNNDQHQKMAFQFGMAWDGKRVVILTFTANSATDKELSSYASAAAGIVHSIVFKPQAVSAAAPH